MSDNKVPRLRNKSNNISSKIVVYKNKSYILNQTHYQEKIEVILNNQTPYSTKCVLTYDNIFYIRQLIEQSWQ